MNLLLLAQLGPWSQVRALYDTVSSLRAEFTEIARYDFGAVDTFRGVMYLAKPMKARLEVSYPETQLVVSDGQVAWLFVPADSQAIRQSVGELSRALDPGVLLFQEGDWEVLYTPREGLHGYTIIPRGQAPYSRVEITLGRDLLPVRLVVHSEGAVFEFTFRGVRLNPELPPGAFQFTPPPWARVFGE